MFSSFLNVVIMHILKLAIDRNVIVVLILSINCYVETDIIL